MNRVGKLAVQSFNGAPWLPTLCQNSFQVPWARAEAATEQVDQFAWGAAVTSLDTDPSLLPGFEFCFAIRWLFDMGHVTSLV